MKRAGRVLAVVMTAFAWSIVAGPGSAGAAAPWLPGVGHEIAVTGGPPAFAVSPGGDVTAAWTRLAPIGGDERPLAFVQRAPADGRPALAPVALAPGGEGSLVAGTARGAGEETLVLHVAVALSGDGAPVTSVQVATVGADGSVGAVRPFAAAVSGVPGSGFAFAGDGTGAALGTFATTDGAGVATLTARLLTADGTLGPLAQLGTLASGTQPELALLPDGTGRALWTDDDDELMTARFAPGGALAGPPQRLSAGGVAATAPALAANAADAVAVWQEPHPDFPGAQQVRMARLPSTGALAGPSVAAVPATAAAFPGTAAALADDGTATIVWSELSDDGASTLLRHRRIASDGTLGAVAALSEAPGLFVDTFPRLARTGGGVRAIWVRNDLAAGRAVVLSRPLAADGALGAQSEIASDTSPFRTIVLPAATDAAGSVTAGWIASGAAGVSDRFATATLDETPPRLTAEVTPTAVEVGEAARFEATAGDASGIVSVRWEFGDGGGADGADGGSATHVYGRAGSYEATVTATDRAGNAAVVRRTVTVVEAPAGPAPGPGTGGGGDDGGSRPPAAARGAAALKLGKVTRRGARVVVTGTVSRRASGRVTLVWTQRAGRRTIRRTVRATIVRGRFSATLRLTPALARARTRATVTVSYAGDADTRPARATKRLAAQRSAPARR